MTDLKSLAESLVNLTVKEANELADILKTDYGIEPAAGAAVAVAAAPEEATASAVEKTDFDVVLKGAGANKLKVVKAIKDLLGKSLKDAKDLAEDAPSTLQEAAPKAEAEELKAKFEELGAEIELK